MGDKSSETVVLCYTSITRREREYELWIVLARGKRRQGNHNGDQPSTKHEGGHMGQKRG